MLKALLCDLDDTVYAPDTGLWPAIGNRITDYIVDRLGLEPDAARALRSSYFQDYGLTLLGLMAVNHVDPIDYLAFVHDLPLAEYIGPDPALNGMLARLPLRKAIFTNADAAHAERVLGQLGIRRHFSDIIDIQSTGYRPKPQPAAYAYALEKLDLEANEVVFADDLATNLAAAHALGIVTVWVRPSVEGPLPEGVDYQVPNLRGLERIVAERLAPAE